ncbi:MAG: hypothetical protein ABMB14_06760 [Myxococcota bacterium]
MFGTIASTMLAGCGALPLDPPPDGAWIVYDPVTGAIPTPNDLARDADAGHLALPIDADAGPAEVAFRTALNLQDGWSSTSSVAFTATSPSGPASIDPGSVTADAVQVWEWGSAPVRVPVVPVIDGASVTFPAPVEGWHAGGRYVVAVTGLVDVDGRPIGADAAFQFLRSTEVLTDHDHAFPGETRAERLATAEQLEQLRLGLAPYFDALAADGIPRDQVSALWTFSVTRRPELAMDAASQRMPLPFDLLIDPETGLVSLPASATDTEVERDAKLVANTLDGFALTADLTFDATLPLDPATVTAATVELWDLTATPIRVPAQVSAWNADGPCAPGADGCVHVVVDPDPIPLDPGTRYAVLVRDGITDRFGEPLAPMAVGQLLRLDDPLTADGASAITVVPDADAVRVEPIRQTVELLLDSVGRDGVVTAWPFRTLDPEDALRDAVGTAEALGYDVTPTVTDRGDVTNLFGPDPLSDLFPGVINVAEPFYLPRVDGVAEVIEGTIPTPSYLDPVTRRWRDTPEALPIRFLATVPAGIPADEPVPVVIFGHALVTDRRFVLTIAGELAKQGFAAISVDFPYHGERTACVDDTLVAVPNFFPEAIQPIVGYTEPLIHVPPCVSGADATCSPTGQCLDVHGVPEPFAAFPVVDVWPASGAAMLEVADLSHVPDHFRQALVDLGSLRWSLQSADWSTALGREIRTDQFLYAGQSLGGIVGAVYVAVDPTIARAVLNVPGADLVDLFADSTYFAPQMDDYLASLGIVKGTWDHERLINVAHWLMDPVDPASVAHLYRTNGRPALIQIDRIDGQRGDIVIPNATTDILQQASGLPMIEYPSVLHGDLVIPLLGDGMLTDLGAFLADGQ